MKGERTQSEKVTDPKYYFSVVFEKTPYGYAVRVVGFDNILTSGENLEDAEKNAKEAISAHIGSMNKEELSLYLPPPADVTVKVLEIVQG